MPSPCRAHTAEPRRDGDVRSRWYRNERSALRFRSMRASKPSEVVEPYCLEASIERSTWETRSVSSDDPDPVWPGEQRI